MNTIVLSTKTPKGQALQAIFLPEKGMALASYSLDEIEVIDQSTKRAFNDCYAGLGPLIGPHFYARHSALIPKTDVVFPHTAQMNQKGGRADPFLHGVARYAAWKAEVRENTIHAELTGKEMLEGVPLSTLEGQNFKIRFDVCLTPKELKLDLSIVSDTDSIIGTHYYYALPKGQGRILSQVQNTHIAEGVRKPLPPEWNIDSQQRLSYPLNQETNFTFFPYPNPLQGEIVLETETYLVITRTRSLSQEHSWKLWHPKGASFVCIEPLSAQDPQHPNLTVSAVGIDLEIQRIN